jgi:hypothetical protein
MSGKVVLPSPVADPIIGSGAGPQQQTEIRPVAGAAASEAVGQADLRLIIEESGVEGHYVYTVMDRRTGKVISRLPRDEVLRLREQAGYEAGAVFNGKV